MLETLSALGESSRLRIVELLRGGALSVTDIGTHLQLRQPQASKHLRVLKEAGLVAVRPVAQQRLYELRPAPFRELHRWLEQYRLLWDARFGELDAVIAELKAEEDSLTRSKKRKHKTKGKRSS